MYNKTDLTVTFFNGIDARSYFASFYNNMKGDVEQISDEEIISCNFQEWVNYLVNKYYITPISIVESEINKEISKTKVSRCNMLRGNSNQVVLDGVLISFTIPFIGNPDLFDIQPSCRIITEFTTKHFVKTNGEDSGSFTLDFEYTEEELHGKGENVSEFVQKKFEHEFENYKKMIGYVNAEVDSYNNSLNDSALRSLKERKEKADSFAILSTALQIPLKLSKNAPNTKPISLKKIVRQLPPKPKVTPPILEYCISDEHYENINNIIALCGTTMEKTARTYCTNGEEELRDHFLVALNTHYDNATGETFRKIGKTDIHIEFDNKAAFIGECKIWHGEKLFQDAIQQVINYSTWRDLKVSVIIFNKENKSFQSILKKIKLWAEADTVSYSQPQTNIWKCTYHRQDMNIDIKLTILAFDLYVDKSLLKISEMKNK